jgi:hypothetical protein
MEVLRRQAFAISLLVLLVFGAGCGANSMYLFQSEFFSNFSLRGLVDRNEARAGLSCSAERGEGGDGMSAGTGAVGKKESNFSKVESLACQISDAELFDEVKFFQALKRSIEQDLDSKKATIFTKNSDATSFDLEYASNETTGTVKISVQKGPMSFYTLKADLWEKSK